MVDVRSWLSRRCKMIASSPQGCSWLKSPREICFVWISADKTGLSTGVRSSEEVGESMGENFRSSKSILKKMSKHMKTRVGSRNVRIRSKVVEIVSESRRYGFIKEGSSAKRNFEEGDGIHRK